MLLDEYFEKLAATDSAASQDDNDNRSRLSRWGDRVRPHVSRRNAVRAGRVMGGVAGLAAGMKLGRPFGRAILGRGLIGGGASAIGGTVGAIGGALTGGLAARAIFGKNKKGTESSASNHDNDNRRR